MEEEDAAIITTFDALMDRLVRPEVFRGFLLKLKSEDTIDLEKLRQHLVGMGYESVYQVDAPGQFAVRGGIVDIFALTEELPYRIELWGDEIDSIRTFDPDSQRSMDALDEVIIYPAAELILTKNQQEVGMKRIQEEGARIAEQYRRDMRTEEAHRLEEAVELVREQVEELGSVRAAESYLTYFYEDTVSFLEFADRCADQKEQKFSESVEALFGKTDSRLINDNFGYDEVEAVAVTSDGKTAIQVCTDGYSKDGINILVGIDENGAVSGIEFVSLGETPGLGSKVRDIETFREQFYGRKEVTDDLDAISGATYSSNGMKKAVDTAIEVYNENKEAILGG